MEQLQIFRSLGELDDQQFLFEPRRHELKLRRWVNEIHDEIIAPLQMASNRNENNFYCKFFELRP